MDTKSHTVFKNGTDLVINSEQIVNTDQYDDLSIMLRITNPRTLMALQIVKCIKNRSKCRRIHYGHLRQYFSTNLTKKA